MAIPFTPKSSTGGAIPFDPKAPKVSAPSIAQAGSSFSYQGIAGVTKGNPYFENVDKNLSSTFKSGAADVTKDVADIQKNAMPKGQEPSTGAGKAINYTLAGLGAAGHIVGDVAKTAGGIIGSFIEPVLPNAVKSKIGNVSDHIDKKIDQIPGMTPEIHKGMADVFNTLTLEGGDKAEAPVKNAITDAAPIVKQAAQQTADTIKDVPGAISESAAEHYKAQSVKDWTKPAEANKAGFKKAASIFNNASSKGHNIADTLVGNGVKLSDHVADGKYATADTAELLREDAGKLSTDLILPSLKDADYSTPRTPIDDIMKVAKDSITSDKSMTAGDKVSAFKALTKETSALKSAHPDGMSLEDMHNNKITYSKNAGHNPIGTMDDNIKASTNNAISGAMKDTLLKKAPKELSPLIDNVNKELSKRYQAADYLKELNSKTVPKGIMSKIAATAAKVTGAVAGEAMGGGILGGVGGYHLGGMVEKFIEDMSNPVKEKFLNNLSRSNPEAFQKMQQYLGNQETQRLMTKQLPEGSPLGSDKNPIVPPAPTTYEKPAESINREKQPDQLMLEAPKSNAQGRPIVLTEKAKNLSQESEATIKRYYRYNPKDGKYYLKGALNGGNKPEIGGSISNAAKK